MRYIKEHHGLLRGWEGAAAMVPAVVLGGDYEEGSGAVCDVVLVQVPL